MGFYPRDDGALGHTLEVTATGLDARGAVLVTRRALARYTPESVVLLEVPLLARCAALARPCAAAETCTATGCREVTVEASLPAYAPLPGVVPAVCDAGLGEVGADATDAAMDGRSDGDTTDALDAGDGARDTGLDAPFDDGLDVRDAPLDRLGDGTVTPDRPDAGETAVRDTGSDVIVTASLRPLSPPSGSIVTSDHPTLRWFRSPEARVRVELCANRACGAGGVIHTAVTMMDSYAVPSSVTLPRSTVFWRLTQVDGADRPVAPSSATWQFTPSRATPPRSSWWGHVPDFNGDGYGDLVVSAPSNTTLSTTSPVFGYYGSATGISPTTPHSPSWTASAPTIGAYGVAMESVGDLNGDGYGDLAVALPNVSSAGAVWVFLGGPSGLSTAVSATIESPRGAGANFGAAVDGAGDVNGDGYGDLLVGAPGEEGNLGAAYVFHGGVRGVATTPARELRLPATEGTGSRFGKSVAGLGDVNGDGYDDVAVGAGYLTLRVGRVRVYHGSAAGLEPEARVVLQGSTDDGFNYSYALSSAGDFNVDGLPDVVVGAYEAAVAGTTTTGRAYVYPGASASGVSVIPIASLQGTEGRFSYFGESVRGVPDVNGDGASDLLVGAPRGGGLDGRVWVFHGTPTPAARVDSVRLTTPDLDSFFGHSLSAIDMDGNGYWEVCVGAYQYSAHAGRVHLFPGGATGLSATPRVFNGTGARDARFGWAIASP